MQLEVFMSAGSDVFNEGLGVPSPKYVAPWISLDCTTDQILCLVEISLTHMKNIELSKWLVALVKGKRERHLSTIIFCDYCDN